MLGNRTARYRWPSRIRSSCTDWRWLARRLRCRRTDNSCARQQSGVHSTHVGPTVIVHYKWHPLYGRRVRRFYSEKRTSGELTHVEAAPGIVCAIPSWMLDRVACAAMPLGQAQANLPALVELDQLLEELGFRRSSEDGINAVTEERHAAEELTHAATPVANRARLKNRGSDERDTTQGGARRAGAVVARSERSKEGGRRG